MRLLIAALIIGCLSAIPICGCSGPVSQSTTPELHPPDAEATAMNPGNRYLWGIWNIRYDSATHQITIEPARHIEVHFNVTHMLLPPECDDCIVIGFNSYSPVTNILDIDVTLINQGNVGAHDVRGIIYTNDYGHTLVNADDWTRLFDIPGGMEINPFKAFAKNIPFRTFYTWASHMENFQIHTPSPPQFHSITFAVDVSWPGTCKEPYSIENFSQTTLFNTYGSKADLCIDVLDWGDNVSSVAIEAPDIIGDLPVQFEHSTEPTWHLELTSLNALEPGIYSALIKADSTDSGSLELFDFVEIDVVENPNQIDVTSPDGGEEWPGGSVQTISWDWVGDITEVRIEYSIDDFINHVETIVESTANTGSFPWSSVPENPSETAKVRVSDKHDPGVFGVSDEHFEIVKTSPFNLVDVTPSEDPFTPLGVFARDNLVYISGGEEGLYIIDVSDLADFQWVSLLDTPGVAKDVVVEGDYAYLAAGDAGLVIADITEPSAPFTISIVDTLGDARGLAVDGNYAYVGAGETGLHIIDISDPENPFLTDSVVTTDDAANVSVSGGYAYVAVLSSGIDIIDVGNPYDAALIKNLDTPGVAYIVVVLDEYAYIADHGSGVQVVDISNPESAFIAKTIDTGPATLDITIEGLYAYTVEKGVGMAIIDISSPLDAQVVEYVDIPSCALRVAASEDYAFVLVGGTAFIIVDTSELTNSHIVDAYSTVGKSYDVVIDDNHAYIANLDVFGLGLIAADIEQPESPQVTGAYPTGRAWGIAITGGCAYVRSGHFSILSIEDPHSIRLINMIDVPAGVGGGLIVNNGYAYHMHHNQNLVPINIEDPDSPYLLESFHLTQVPLCIDLYEDRLFLGTSWGGGVQILNISDPEEIYLESTIPTIAIVNLDVFVNNDLAYVTEDANFAIYDVGDIQDIDLLSVLHMPTVLEGIEVSDGYAYIAASESGLRIVDVDPPELAYLVASLDLPGDARGLAINNNYAYVACMEGGLRIVKLW